MPFQFIDDLAPTASAPPVVPPKNFGSTSGEPRSPQTPKKSSFKFVDDEQQTTADSLLQPPPPSGQAPFALLDDKVAAPSAKDLEELMAQGYKPTDPDLRTIYQGEKNEPILPKIGKGIKEGVTGIVKPFVKAPGEIAADPSASRLLASAGEGIVGAAAGTVGLVTKPVKFAYRKLVQEPESSDEENYQRWRLNYLTTHDVGVTPLPKSIMESWVKSVTDGGEDLPEKAITQPYPNTSSAIGTLAALPMFEAGAEVSGLNKLITNPNLNVAGKTLGVTGKTLGKVGKAAETVGGLPQRVAEGLTEKVFGEKLAGKFGKAVDVGELPVAGTAALLGHHTVAGVLAGAKALKKVGPVLTEAGQYATRLAEADPASPFGRLFTVAKDTTAPEWMRELSNHWVAKVPAAIAETTATGAKAATVGGLFGGGLSAISGDDPEEIGRNIGAGAALGVATAGASAPALRKARILQATMASVDKLYQAHIAEGIQPEALKRVGNDAMTWAATAQQIFGDGTKIRFAQEGPNSPLPQTVYGQAGQYVPETKTAWINVSRGRDPAETVLHEILHPIFDNGVANTPEVKQTLANALGENGRTPYQAKVRYVMSELREQLRNLPPLERQKIIDDHISRRDTFSQQTTGDPDHWVYAELLSESAVQALYGQHPVLDVTNPGLVRSLKEIALPPIQDLLSRIGVKFNKAPARGNRPATVLPGFENVIDSPSLRKTVYSLIKAQKDFMPGLSEGETQGTPISKELWGQHPAATLEPQANGTAANDFVIQNPDGRIIPRSPRQVKKIVKSRRDEINKLYPPDAPPADLADKTTDVKPRKTPSGLVQRTGTTLGPDFDKLTTVGPKTKALAHQLEQMIAAGQSGSGWYQQIGKEKPGTDWKASVQKDTGAIEAQYKDFIPFQFRADKQGNLLVDNTSLTAFQRKAAQWAQRHGEIGLDVWGGDVGHFAKDVQTYFQNHAQGLPGEANNLGIEKKNIINAFLIGGNRAFGEKNPLRELLKGEDRQGIIRSYRLDRLETLEPLDSDFAKPDYNKQVQNLSPESFSPTIEDVEKLSPADFFNMAEGWAKSAVGGNGLTVQAMAEAAAQQNPNRAQWETAAKNAQAEARKIRDEVLAKPASMMERQKELMGAAQKSQFFSEALKKLPSEEPGKLSPTTDEPLTEAGKKLVEQGYTFKVRENEDAGEGERSIKVALWKDKEVVGHIVARLPSESSTIHGKNALIDNVKIEPAFRGQKLSEPLYRELFVRLQEKGMTRTTGFVVHPAPLKLRDKLLGKPIEKDIVEGSSANGRFPTTYVTHEINPAAKFSPDLDKIKQEGQHYEIVPKGENPLNTDRGHGKYYLTPELRWIAVDEHNDAAKEILGRRDKFVREYTKQKDMGPGNSAAQLNYNWTRIIDDGDALYIESSNEPTAKQIKEIKDVGIENKKIVMRADYKGQQTIYDPSDPSSFSPAPDPSKEHIVAAALQDASGNVYKGTTHADALEKAIAAGHDFDPEGSDTSDGFVTSNGRFVDRDEAAKVAAAAKQLGEPKNPMIERTYGDARKDTWLESMAFGNQREFSPALAATAPAEKKPAESIPPTLPKLASDEKGLKVYVENNVDKTKLSPPTFGEWEEKQGATKVTAPVTKTPKIGKEWELKSGGTSGFSKAWLLPNGIPMQLGSTYHERGLNGAPDLLSKYGLEGVTSGEDIRAAALRKGFARVNYNTSNGRFTIEARSKDLDNLTPAIIKLVQANAGKIDLIEINLFDTRVRRVVNSGEVKVFDLDNSEKAKHIPIISEPSSLVEMSPQASSAQLSPDTRKPNDEVRKNAAGYMAKFQQPYTPHEGYTPIDEAYSRNVADFYQAAKHDPLNKLVQSAYEAFGKETIDQWNYLVSHGVKFEPWTKPGQPYINSAAMAKDVRENKHLWFFPTEGGFGTESVEGQNHPLLAPSGIKIGDKELPINDLFRAVHDYFGHAKEGYEFGPRGEYNAYLAHSKMYSAAALPAMGMETMGQNSWVNFGAHMRDANGAIPTKGQPGFVPLTERAFAEQKAALLPSSLQQLSPNIDEAAETIAKVTKENGGASYNVLENKLIGKTAAYGVSLYPERSKILEPDKVTPEEIKNFILLNGDLLEKKDHAVGTWLDKSTGKVYVDVSVGLPDRKFALYAGRHTNQKAIWDSAQGREISTGGTGEPAKNLPEPSVRLQKLQEKFDHEHERPTHAYDSRFKQQGMMSPETVEDVVPSELKTKFEKAKTPAAISNLITQNEDKLAAALGEDNEGFISCDHAAAILSHYLAKKKIPHEIILGFPGGESHSFVRASGRDYDPTKQGVGPKGKQSVQTAFDGKKFLKPEAEAVP